MTAATEHSPDKKISRRNPDTDLEIISFYIGGDSTTTPSIEFQSYGGGITVLKGGEPWSDDFRGFELCLEISDEPDGYQSRVLMGDTLCSDWVLEEAIRTLTSIRRQHAALRAASTGQSLRLVDSTEICDSTPKCDAPAVTVVAGIPVCREHLS